MTRSSEAGLQPDFNLKVLVVGDSSVGKTSLLNRFINESFEDHINATVGVDFGVKTIIIYDKVVKLNIWDTAGQEKFRTLTSTFYRGVKGVIFVYDVTCPETLHNLENYWFKELDIYSAKSEVVKMIVANKVDKSEDRKITWQQGADFAMQYGALFVETSAKANVAVKTAFEELVLKIMDTPTLINEDATPPIDLTSRNSGSLGYESQCSC